MARAANLWLCSLTLWVLVCASSVAKSCLTLCDPTDHIAHLALSMEVPTQECWSGLPFPSPGDLSNPEIEPKSPTLRSRFLTTKLPAKPLWLLVEKPWHSCVWRMQTQVCRAACRFPGTCVLFVFHQCSSSNFYWTEMRSSCGLIWVSPGVCDGQGGLACCNSWGRKESDTTEWLNWTEL